MGARSEGAEHFGHGSKDFVIRTLGNRADLISDGDALVEVQVPHNVRLDRVKVTLNGKDITASFSADAAAQTLRRLVKGLQVGKNELAVQSKPGKGNGHGFGHDNHDDASLTITNHPRGGPILLARRHSRGSAPTPAPVPQNGDTPASNASGLTTTAVDAQCNIATEYKLFYRTTTAGCSSALPDPEPTGRATHQQLLQALHARRDATRSGDDDHHHRADGALHRARRTWHDEPRHL